MSVVSGLGKAAGAGVLSGSRPARGRAFRKTKKALVVGLALLAFAVFAALIPASQAPRAEHSYSVVSTNSQSGTAAPVSSEPPAATPRMSEEEALDAYAKLPLSFIPNEGQTNEAVRYYAQGAGYGFFFSPGEAMLSFGEVKGRGHALGLDFIGANPEATLEAQKRLSGEVNYLVGDDPAKWQQGLQTHAELLYGGLWTGIDMAVRGEGGNLKYEFRLKPGSSVEDVRLAYRGAEGLKIGAGGELLVRTSLGILKDAAPVSYQRIGGERVPVQSRYVLKGDSGGYGFAVGSYDPRYPLVIDPGLAYSTFLGGTEIERGEGIAVRDGNAYVTGTTFSADFPTTPGAFDTSLNFVDAFVTKLNDSGSALVYSTLLGGTDFEFGSDIAVDTRGRAYVTGTTFSADFPTTSGAFDTTFNGIEGSVGDAFVTKLNATGSALVYSTLLGGSDRENGSGIAVRDGNAYVTGATESADFPTTPGAFDTSFAGGNDAFVTKLNATGSALVYSTLLGRRKFDGTSDIAVEDGNAYVTGHTTSANYPTTPGAFDTTLNGNQDAFVTKLNRSGSALAYSTLLGGTIRESCCADDSGNGIAVRDGNAYVIGFTPTADFPTTPGAFDTTFNGNDEAFVTKLNATGSALVYSTFLGGTSFFDNGTGIAVRDGNAYVTGTTSSADFPTTPDAFDRTLGGSQDAFATKFNATGSALVYSTFLGGTEVDEGGSIAVRDGNAYVTGTTDSADFPTTPGAFDTTFNGAVDAFVTKLPTG